MPKFSINQARKTMLLMHHHDKISKKIRRFTCLGRKSIFRYCNSAYTIEANDKPVNYFKNLIVLQEANFPQTRKLIIFTEKNRHKIDSVDKNTLFDDMKLVVNPGVVNAIRCNLPSLACTRHELVRYFPSTKFWYSKDKN